MIPLKWLTCKAEQTSDFSLAAVYRHYTKEQLQEICRKLDLYVPASYAKDKAAARLAQEVIENIDYLLCGLTKAELEIVDEAVKGGENFFVVRKERRTPLKLQKFGIMLTHVDEENHKWLLIMPNEVRLAVAPRYGVFLDYAQRGIKLSPKQLRMGAMIRTILGNAEETDSLL